MFVPLDGPVSSFRYQMLTSEYLIITATPANMPSASPLSVYISRRTLRRSSPTRTTEYYFSLSPVLYQVRSTSTMHLPASSLLATSLLLSSCSAASVISPPDRWIRYNLDVPADMAPDTVMTDVDIAHDGIDDYLLTKRKQSKFAKL